MYIIIGGSSDLAKDIVKNLVKEDDIILTYNTKKKINYIKSNKHKVYFDKLDLDNLKSIKNFIKKRSKILKNIKFLNLATLTIDKLIHDIEIKDINKIFNINYFSNIILTKELLPLMIKQNYGKFIFFTSTRAARGDKGISLYSSSKESLSAFSKCLAKEYAQFNITSNCIKLGYFKSKLFNNISPEIRKKLENQIPSKKLGEVKNIIRAIKMITKTNYINGANISIDGGI